MVAGGAPGPGGRGAQWVGISCPPEVSPYGSAALWRLVAPRLGCGRVLRRRRTVAWELRATPAGVRAAVWVPPGVPAAAVAAAVGDAWPGAQAGTRAAGDVPAAPVPARVTAVRLRPSVPGWLPVGPVDRPHRQRALPEEADLLRVVFAALSGCRSAEVSAGVQILVRPARRRHARRSAAALRRLRGLRGLPRRPWLARRAPLALFDLVTGAEVAVPRRAVIYPQIADPLGPARLHALAAKAAAGPHFDVAVRILASGGSRAGRRALVRAVAAGFGLVTGDAPVPADLAARRLWRPARQLRTRCAPRRHWFTASLPEVAALAGLPAQPARYGLVIAAARRFPPPPEVLAA